MNVLLITTDQQRKDSLGVYNKSVNTPNIDSIAGDGVVFDRAYITHSTCTPSRATLLTGQYASKHGAYTIGTALDPSVTLFSNEFKRNGYNTYFVGKPHFQQIGAKGSFECFEKAMDESFWRDYRGSYYGFDNLSLHNGHTIYPITAGMHYRLWLKDKGLTDQDISEYFNYQSKESYRTHGEWTIPKALHPTVYVADRAVDYLSECDTDEPFVMWVSFSDPHDPHVVPKPYATMYDPNKVNYLGYKEGELDDKPSCYKELYEKDYHNLSFSDEYGVPSAPSGKFFGDDQYYKEITAVHHGMVKLIDEEVGRIIQELKRKGMYDDTFIVFTTDHGDTLGNHGFVYKGFPAYEEVYNVPFIIKDILQDIPHEDNHEAIKDGITRSSALMSHVDVASTILSAAGITVPSDMDGCNQLQVVRGERESVRDEVYIENRLVKSGFYQKMIVTQEYKLVMYMDSLEGELYDLSIDRNQYVNLWDQVEWDSIKNQLLNRLAKTQIQHGNLECLNIISEQMHNEEQVQDRKSFS